MFEVKPVSIAVLLTLGGCAMPGGSVTEQFVAPTANNEVVSTPATANAPTVPPHAITVAPQSARPLEPRRRTEPPTYNFQYQVTWGERTGLTRIFDDGMDTYIEFGKPLNSDFGVHSATGTALRYEKYGSYVIVPGIHQGVLVRSGNDFTNIVARVQEHRAPAGFLAAPPPPPANVAEIAETQAQLGRANDKLQELTAELKAVQTGTANRSLAAIAHDMDELETNINGIAASVLRVRFLSGATELSLPEEVRSGLISAAMQAGKIIVRGRTDSVGSMELNKQIAFARARSAKRMLIDHGVSAKKITVNSLAGGDYVASNATAEGRAKNRRVEFVFVGETERQRLGINRDDAWPWYRRTLISSTARD